MFRTMSPRSLAAVAAVAIVLGCGDDPPPPPAPVAVVVAPVERRPVPVELSATGTVEPIKTVAVEAQVSGLLQRVGFREGEDVSAGQVLFEIDPRPYRAALAQAEAQLVRARAQAANAVQEETRYRTLAEKQYVTAQQYDEARAAAAAAQATVAANEAAAEEARLNLQYATIRAPVAGRTGSLLVREGNLVRANSGTALVTINQLRPIRVRFAVPATNLSLIQQQRGRELVVRAVPAGGGSPAVGRLSFIDNAVDTLTGTVLLKGEFPNTDGALWPGAFVNTRLELYVERDALVVPAAAVVSGQQGSYLYLIQRDSTARSVPVTVERPVGAEVVVRGEVSPGDRVVTDGQLRIRPGAKVQIRTAETTAPREVSEAP
jgi:multidrug efflux system membrane fusion protein